MSDNDQASVPSQSSGERVKGDPSSPGKSKFRLRNVLMVVVPVAIFAGGALALARFGDLDVMMERLTRPALAPVRGQVLYNGQPLRGGQIMTWPASGRGRSAIGWTDDEGRFTLQTDIRGEYTEGATVGEHRVTVTAYELISAPAAPPLLTPAKYASAETTPLTITVRRNPEENQFQLTLEGEPPSRPKRAGGPGGDSPNRKAPPDSTSSEEDTSSSEEPAEETKAPTEEPAREE
ncbi:MAG: DUF4198 domain-containing protein [Planctomycetes bacterium]|nr:DUF4198 domain-containing protein [Planctomycetota bacterium]